MWATHAPVVESKIKETVVSLQKAKIAMPVDVKVLAFWVGAGGCLAWGDAGCERWGPNFFVCLLLAFWEGSLLVAAGCSWLHSKQQQEACLEPLFYFGSVPCWLLVRFPLFPSTC